MSLTSQRLALSYLAEAQAQKHVTVNESLRRLDAVVHLTVISRQRADEPEDPQDGDGYIVPENATGAAWAGRPAGTLALRQEGAWHFIDPCTGMIAHIGDEESLAVHDGTAWRSLLNLPRLGIGTEADASNRLSVKADGALFTHDDVTPGTGDMRLVVNKAAASTTASVLFQSDYEGKAEFGLTGTDDFAIKVKGDDGVFRTAILIDRQTGTVSFPNTA
jgi:hypothetical protein